MPERLMTEEYFRQKYSAVYIINLVDYLNKNEITEENLDNKDILNDIVRKGMGKSVKSLLPKNQINVFKETLLLLKIDKLKKTNLYRINRGVLTVACVEHVLYPGKDHKEYRNIYQCNQLLATRVYKKLRELCDLPTEDELDPAIVKSARSFFKSSLFLHTKASLETVRSYLKSVDINDDEKFYIKNASIQLINGTETISTAPWKVNVINREYFQKKTNADALINLVNYLENNEVKENDLKNEKILIDVLRKGVKKFVNYLPMKLQLEEFKKAILNFTIDYLTVTNLYRINRGILTVACVEYVLFPGQDYEEYKKIYGCECGKATALYKELCGIPIEEKVNEAVAKSARSFFRCQNRNLETIRLYLQNIDIGSEEIEYIKNASILLINKAIDADQPPTKTMDPIEDHSINVATDDEETLPPVPDMPLVNVDPPSVVSLPVEQGLIMSNEDELSTNMIDSIEYHTINVPIDGEQPHPNMIQIIYPDISSFNVDPPSVVSVPVEQGLIISNEDELSTNMMDPIEDHPINEITGDEETLPPMPDMPLVHVDPPSVVLIPVDQGFLSRYSPNEVVLAKRFNSYFWPAQIIEVYSDKMYVTFFPLSEEMEKEEVSSEEDVKAFAEEEMKATRASLCTGLSRNAFEFAVKFAAAELNRIHSP